VYAHTPVPELGQSLSIVNYLHVQVIIDSETHRARGRIGVLDYIINGFLDDSVGCNFNSRRKFGKVFWSVKINDQLSRLQVSCVLTNGANKPQLVQGGWSQTMDEKSNVFHRRLGLTPNFLQHFGGFV
jgi:hypothetical protein